MMFPNQLTQRYTFNSSRMISIYCNPHWIEEFATLLLPNYWLAETLQANALMRLGRQSVEREQFLDSTKLFK
jgi:hypothetical protein